MGVYIDGLDIPKPIKGIKTCYDILIKSDGTVSEYDSDGRYEYKAEEIDLVRCGECEYADEYNHCKYSAWWNGNADFCSHGIQRKENR